MNQRTFDIPADLMAGQTALVAGGTGSVGRVAVKAFLEAGATVVVPSRSEYKVSELRRSLGDYPSDRLITLLGDLSSEEEAIRVREEVQQNAGPLDAAVATLGRFVAAPSVLEASLSDLQAVIDGYLLAHFMVAKTFVPALEERSGSYTFINGPLAFQPMFPGTGLVSVVTAGQAMLAQTVMKDHESSPVRVNELVVYTRFGGDGDEDQNRGAVSQGDVGSFLSYLASDHGARVRGDTVHLNSPSPLRSLQQQA